MRRQFHFLGEMTDEGFVGHDREEVRQALLDLEGALYQLGGMVTVSSVRREISEGEFITTGVLMAYDSFAPKLEDKPTSEDTPAEVEDGAARA